MHDGHSHNHDHGHDHVHSGESTIVHELLCHLPYAIYSVAFSLIILSIYSVFTMGLDPVLAKKGSKALFHSFHFMHVVFAATGTIITFCRFSKNYFRALIVGSISTIFFCILSDAVLPYVVGRILGVDMHFHMCFITEPQRVIPFLIMGLINGFVLSMHHSSKQGGYSLTSHASHIAISSLASTFYLISHGFTNWYVSIGNVFVLLIIAVVIPCTLADVVVPMTMARLGRKNT